MQKQELFERIENYLNQTLSPEERRAFDQELADDPELRKAVELHRSLHEDYNTGRLQLRANLRNIMQEPLPPDPPPAAGGKLRWGLWLAILGLALFLVWRFWPEHKIAPVLPPAPPAALPPTPADPGPQKENSPIAQVDPARFAPNPGMEALVKSSVRSQSIEVTLRKPVNGRRFMPDENGVVWVRFEGSAHWSGEMRPSRFSVLFFNNKNTDQPLLEVPINVPAAATDSLKIGLHQRLKFSPGLYYFTLEDADKGEILYAGKLLIGQ